MRNGGFRSSRYTLRRFQQRADRRPDNSGTGRARISRQHEADSVAFARRIAAASLGSERLRRPLQGLSFQDLSIPTRPVGRGLISLLQKTEQQRVRIWRSTNGVVGKNELPETTIVESLGCTQTRVAVAGRFRIGVY